MSVVDKPYDLLFKHTMGSDVALQDFIRNHLPKHIYERIDPASIKPTKHSFVPPELKELHSDLVCSCTIDGQEALLYLIVEHQSTESWLMPLRIIKYKVAAIEDFLQGKPEGTPWPIVVCACFYHGKTSPYPYSANVYDYFANPSLAQELGSFDRFHLIDLTVIEPEVMQQHGSLALLEQILKYSRDRDFFNLLKELLETYKDTLLSLESPLGSDYWHAVYLVAQRILTTLGYGEAAAADLFSKRLNLSKSKEEIMTITQAIRQEGRQEGMQEGMQEGRQAEKLVIARNLLRKNMDVCFITETTGLDKTTITKLEEASQEA